jgi:hypothetical protein
MTRRRCPACGEPRALLLREGVGGLLAICANGCPRSAIVAALRTGVRVQPLHKSGARR